MLFYRDSISRLSEILLSDLSQWSIASAPRTSVDQTKKYLFKLSILLYVSNVTKCKLSLILKQFLHKRVEIELFFTSGSLSFRRKLWWLWCLKFFYFIVTMRVKFYFLQDTDNKECGIISVYPTFIPTEGKVSAPNSGDGGVVV